jgi:benzodiazapine receptor
MRTVMAVVVGVAACLAVGAAPLAVAPVDDWYRHLVRPAWTPPDAAFGIVWPVLFVMMGTAAGLAAVRRPAVVVPFAVQMVFNAAWSVLFFRYHRIGAALVEVLLLWCAIGVTIAAFGRVRPVAAWLLVPYLGWVTFAAALNTAFWRLNG